MSQYHSLADIPVQDVVVGKLQMLAGGELMMLWTQPDAGSQVPRHAHAREQLVWLRSGEMSFRIGDEPLRRCLAGTVLIVPGHVPHETWYLQDCEIVEVFSPPRHDILELVSRKDER